MLLTRCQAYARGRPELQRLLALVDGPAAAAELRLADDVATAHIAFDEARERFAVCVGAGFLREQVRDDADLTFVVAHELMHLVRGEIWLPPDPETAVAANVASDTINNAFLLGPGLGRAFAGVSGIWARRDLRNPVGALLTPLESAADRLGLVPVRGRADTAVRRRLFEHARPSTRGQAPYDPSAWVEAHAQLEERGRVGAIELSEGIERVRPLLRQLPTSAPPHAGGLPRSAAAQAALRALQQRHPGVCGDGGEVRMALAPPTPEQRLTRWLRGFAGSTPGRALVEGPLGLSVRPTDAGSALDRRAVVEYAAGLRAMPFGAPVREGGPNTAGLVVYLDASGSMDAALPPLLGDLGSRGHEWLSLPVRVFSTRVFEVGLADLRVGRLPTTGGTSFDAVARDLLASGVRRAAVITDGEGHLAPSLLHRLRARGVALATVSPGRVAATPFDPLVAPRHRWALSLDAH